MQLETDKYKNKVDMLSAKLRVVADNIEELRLAIWSDLNDFGESKENNDNLLFKIQSNIRNIAEIITDDYEDISDEIIKKRQELEEKIKMLQEELRYTYI